MTPEIRLPPGAEARLFLRHGNPTPHLVALAVPPLAADPLEITNRPGGLFAVITHNPGMTWPDAKGCALASAVIGAGGGVVLGFATLGDALACHARLKRHVAQ